MRYSEEERKWRLEALAYVRDIQVEGGKFILIEDVLKAAECLYAWLTGSEGDTK